MDGVAAASVVANLACRFFTFLYIHLFLALGAGDFMDLYLTCRSPDDEIWHVGMRGSLRVRKSKSVRLAPVGLHSGIALKHEGELAFLEGLPLDRFFFFAVDVLAQVII